MSFDPRWTPILGPEGAQDVDATTPGPLVAALLNGFPDGATAARLQARGGDLVYTLDNHPSTVAGLILVNGATIELTSRDQITQMLIISGRNISVHFFSGSSGSRI